MTDEQFDEVCRGALAFEPGAAKATTWSRIRPAKWNWLPTVPEILACGCACGLILLALGVRFDQRSTITADSNPVIEKALGGSSAGLQASAFQVPDTTPWTETALTLPAVAGAFSR